MRKKSRIEIAREIVSRVKKEMNEPRLAQSVRNGFRVVAAPAVEKPAGAERS
jgi:transcriptional regulator of NAD metabolism